MPHLLTQSSGDGHLGCLHLGAIANSATTPLDDKSKLSDHLIAVPDSLSRILNQSVYNLLVSPGDLMRRPDSPQGKVSWPEITHS